MRNGRVLQRRLAAVAVPDQRVEGSARGGKGGLPRGAGPRNQSNPPSPFTLAFTLACEATGR